MKNFIKLHPVLSYYHLVFTISWDGGLLEETGWTGFTVPKLRMKYNILSTGLIVGTLWGIWHFMIAFWATDYLKGTESRIMFVAGFIAFYLLALPAYRVLLVLVYDRTVSLPIIMIMHAFFSASTLILQPSPTGEIGFVWNLILGIILWMVVAVIGIKNKLLFQQKPNKKEE